MTIMLILMGVTYAAAIVFDFRPRLAESGKCEKILLAILFISLVPLVLNAMDVKVPSPAKPIEQAVKAMFHVS